LPPETVRSHCKAVKTKLMARNRTACPVIALRLQLVRWGFSWTCEAACYWSPGNSPPPMFKPSPNRRPHRAWGHGNR